MFSQAGAIFRLTALSRYRYEFDYAIVKGRLGRKQGRCSET